MKCVDRSNHLPDFLFRDENFLRENNCNAILRLLHHFFKGLEGLRYKGFLQILKEIVKHHQNSVINIFPGIFCREKIFPTNDFTY